MLAWAIFNSGFFQQVPLWAENVACSPCYCIVQKKYTEEGNEFFPQTAKRTSCLPKSDYRINPSDDTT